jgi:hypothetical protein
LNFVVEDSYVFSVKNLDIAGLKIWHLRVVELSWLVFEKAIALADTVAVVTRFVFAVAAQLAV